VIYDRRMRHRPEPPAGVAGSEDPHVAPAPLDGTRGEVAEATRRTHLASERTYLAWWRTGLTALTVGIGAGKIAPALTSGATWPYTVAGAGFAVLGVVCIVYAALRRREVDEALARGDFVGPNDRVIGLMTVLGAVLGVLLLAIVLAEG
jgi:putative membrane protein